LTGVGFAISILVIYTSIYRVRRKELETQKSALMLSQINPHFVYNTLSTIVAMCEVSPPQAKGLTLDFAQYLRKNIDSLNSEDMIPFDQEMEHVSCYLKIEKARFMERLNVMYSIRCKDFDIPPLTIQPLVENAIKHGITKKVEGGTLKISTYAEKKNYIIEIIDDGIGFDTELSELHVGIKNVRTRLETMCKGKLTIKSMVGVGTRVRIELPMKKGKKK
jgi:LytS/YehU family sensor histidine kinase